MDPDQCLAEIRSHLNDPDEFALLAEKVQALDEWLSRGGALPHKWGRYHQQSETVMP